MGRSFLNRRTCARCSHGGSNQNVIADKCTELMQPRSPGDRPALCSEVGKYHYPACRCRSCQFERSERFVQGIGACSWPYKLPYASRAGGRGAAGSLLQQGRIQPTAGIAPGMSALANMLYRTSRTTSSLKEIKQPANFYPFTSQNGNISSRIMQKAGKFPAKKPYFLSLWTSTASSGPGHTPAICARAPGPLPLMLLCPLAVIFLSNGRRSR